MSELSSCGCGAPGYTSSEPDVDGQYRIVYCTRSHVELNLCPRYLVGLEVQRGVFPQGYMRERPLSDHVLDITDRIGKVLGLPWAKEE